MKQSLRLGTISGIPVGLHWGMAVIAVLYLASLATGLLPDAVPGASTMAYWGVAGVGVVLFFASVVAHEIGHSVVAQREGIQVRAITLWLLGGVAEIEREAESPGAEFRIAAAGPAVSLALALTFSGIGMAVGAAFGTSVLSTMIIWLGLINGFLAVFNLLPAAPLDGGRILAAFLWWRNGNPHRARARAAFVGQGFGIAVSALGAFSLFNGGSVILLILGWFLVSAASAERRRAELFGIAARATVADAMAPLAPPTDAAVTAEGLAAMSGDTTRAFPVRGADGVIVGIVSPDALRGVQPRRHGGVTAGDLAVDWSHFVAARVDEPLSVLFDRFRDADTTHALVYDRWGQQLGYVGLAELDQARHLTPA